VKPPNFPENFAEFRRAQVGRTQAPIYAPIRFLSTPLSWRLTLGGVSPNAVTALGAALALGAAVAFATGHSPWMPLGGALIFASYICDCMDGEMARLKGSASAFGGQLDQLTNWLTMVALQTGLACGAYQSSRRPEFLLLGMLSIGGWCSFYYLYLQIASWTEASAEYYYLRRLSGTLLWVMPLDENVVLLTGLACQPQAGLIVSAAASLFLCFAVSALYIGYNLASPRR